MEDANKTIVTEFILLGFSDFQTLQVVFSVVILVMYILCISGNCVIILLIRADISLHTPMYFFISIFACLEIMFVLVTIPKLLDNLIAANKRISFGGCFAQLYSFNALGVTECYLLAVMVFDRHLAIDKPLQYVSIMSHGTCVVFAVIPWLIGFLDSLIPVIFTAHLDFCGPRELNHFFCDLAPLQKLSCSDPYVSVIATSAAGTFNVVVPFIIIIGFYMHIIMTVFKINSDEGKQKALSTCSSHIIVTGLFYGTATIVYVTPMGSQYNRFLALMYTIVTPVVNPFIYTLRNRDVKGVLKTKTRQILQLF